MKKFASILFFIVISKVSFCQFYYRGEILDEKGKLVPNGIILMHSSKMLYNAGSSGSFGMMSTKPFVDTFTIACDGYEKITTPVYVDKYNTIKLNLLSSVASLQKNRLASITKDLKNQYQKSLFSSNETYSDLVENDFVNAETYPITGFAVNTDRASYSNIRRFVNMKSQVPTNAVRIDEMINYFNFPSVEVKKGETFNISSQITQCPWNLKNFLLFVNIAAKKIDLDKIPPSNLVFLIDNSGSMELQNRMPLLKSAFKLLVKNLRSKDKVTIITYGGNVNVALPPISGFYQDSILKVIEEMVASGDTPGESAINIAYNIAKQNFIKDGNNRVILATDGDFNVGVADEVELERLISLQSQTGIYLTCLGVGMGNYKDSKLEVLAKKGNGNFAYIDNESEGEKILVTEMTQTLFSVADNAYMNIKFNKNLIDKYRLIGFDNKRNAIADTASKLEGGQVGSGYSTMVVFEIVGSNVINVDSVNHILGEDVARINVNYEIPITKKKQVVEFTCKYNFMPLLGLPKQYGFAAAITMFGAYIKQSKYNGSTTLEDIQKLAIQSLDNNSVLQKEFIQIIEKSKNIYEGNKKKKKKKASEQN